MALPKQLNDSYTYADYITWDDDNRWEIIDGWPYAMSPAPTRKHQQIAGNLHSVFHNYLNQKSCEVYISPFDVCLCEKNASDEEIETVVQPDISIFCDLSKLNDKGAKGAPDLIVEILSESTYKKDLGIKLLLYLKHKVKEYWVIDPATDSLIVYKLDNKGSYEIEKEFLKDERVKVGIFEDLEISLQNIFG